MEPVVNGLEMSYMDQIEFRTINAGTPDGQAMFRSFGLPGHPSYVLLNPAGEVLWTGFGEQARENIEVRLEEALAGP